MRLNQTISRYLPITAWLAESSPRKDILAGIAVAGLFATLSQRTHTLGKCSRIRGVTMQAEILSYSRSRGLFAGISLSGSTLRADNGANKNLYGKEVSAQAIVFNKAVPVPDCAKNLLATLQKATPVNKSKS